MFVNIIKKLTVKVEIWISCQITKNDSCYNFKNLPSQEHSMKSHFKFILSASALALTLGMVGCGESNNASTQTASELAPATDNLPVLQVVTDGESPPMTFTDENHEPKGIDIDIIRAIGESQGFKVEVHFDLFNNLFSGIDSGKYQIAISSLSLTPERASKYGHSDSYLQNPALILHNQANLTDINELKNLRVASTKGTIYTSMIEELQPARHRVTNTNFQGYQELLQGHVDAVMADKYILEYMAVRHDQKKFNSFEYRIGDGSSANMVIYTKKGDQELIDKLNKGIAELKQSGKMDTIVQSYMGSAK